MVQYCIPSLLSHLQAYITPNDPNSDILEVEHIAWIDTCSFFSDLDKKAWKDTEIPLAVVRMFPGSSLEHSRIICKYLILSRLTEQLTDEPATSTQAQKWGNIFKQALEQRLGETEEHAADIIKSLTSRILNAVNQPYQICLIRDNIDLAESMVKEAADRENSAPRLDLETYMKARRHTIGIRPLFDIGRWIYESDIADEILNHPDIVKMEERFVDLVALANDLYSFKKEFLECGAYHNYITVALKDSKTGLLEDDLQGAIDYTYRQFYVTLKDVERQNELIPSFGGNEDAKVVTYIRVMMNVVIGTIQWSLECGRYGHFAEAQNRGDVVFDMSHL